MMVPHLAGVDWSYFGRPCVGERVSGDVAIVKETDNFVFVALVDVLGHGQEAYDTARQAKAYLKKHWSSDVVRTMSELHENLSGTRGAAVGIGVIDLAKDQLNYCGVGNIVARKIGKRSMYLRTTDGIVGSHIKTIWAETAAMEPSDLVLLFSDGVSDRFSSEDLLSLQSRDAWTIARDMVKDFGKFYDDATCIALRYKR